MTKLSPLTSPKTTGDLSPTGIPTFVKPGRVRNVSNITIDADGNPSASSANARTSESSITFGPQSNLPRLPVPSLEATMAKFLKTLEALEADADPEEKLATQKAVRDFLKDGRKGDGTSEDSVTGPVLQELLMSYDKLGRETGSYGSYVEEFWNDAFLAPDSSVVLNLNPYFLLEESPDPKLAGNQILRAASLCFASIKMASQLRNETFKPDTFRGKALCMAQFRALFGAARIPKSRSRDIVSTHPKSNHVAVMCSNQLFYFQALWPDTGEVAVDEQDIAKILEAIKDHAENPGSKNAESDNQHKYLNSVSAVGVLTSLERNEWARIREEMINNSTRNADSFRAIDSALFVLVLDDFIPKTKDEAAANMLHGSYGLTEIALEGYASSKEYQSGTCINRWYDKLQIIVTADGGAGINFEHSAIDGHTALRFVSDIYADTVMSFAQTITRLVPAHKGLIPSVIEANVRRAADVLDDKGKIALDVSPHKIIFDLSDVVKRKIYFAETKFGDQILASDTRILEFKDYGKHFITFNKLSPDSYVQMSMMLAYYRLYGKVVCAYEPVLTKSFYHGRTEAMRPATMEAKHFCEVFCNPSSSAREKVNALRNATMAHSKLVKECAQGKGVDRHLFALKCIAEKNGLPIPEFFRSEAWRKLNHTFLSTSNCGNPSLALFGFGPVVPDGYGIGYIIKDSQIHYAICSKHRQTKRYALTLEGVLLEMASLLEPIRSTRVNDHSSKASSMMVSTDSYGDLWGESSLSQFFPNDGRPEVIQEGTAQHRWSDGARNDIVTDDPATLFLSPVQMPVKVPLNDVSDSVPSLSPPIKTLLNNVTTSPTAITAIPEDRVDSKRHRRRGSYDLMPIRPARRGSGNSKSDVEDLANLDIGLDQLLPGKLTSTLKLDDYLEETKNVVINEAVSGETFLTPPLVAALKDEVDQALPVTTAIPEDRVKGHRRTGSSDLMPIRPARRSSVVTLTKKELADIKNLTEDLDKESKPPGHDQ